jgi:hypothetical protein
VLHEVVRTNLERFLDEAAAATDGAWVPRFKTLSDADVAAVASHLKGLAAAR